MDTRRYWSHSDFIHRTDGIEMHLPHEPWLLPSSPHISWKGWSLLRGCIVFYMDNLYLTEQNSRLVLKTNRPNTFAGSGPIAQLPTWWDWLTMMTSTEALEELDFPCCWVSEHLDPEGRLGKDVRAYYCSPTQVLLFCFAKQLVPSISADCCLIWYSLFFFSLGKSWGIRTWALWFLHVD